MVEAGGLVSSGGMLPGFMHNTVVVFLYSWIERPAVSLPFLFYFELFSLVEWYCHTHVITAI